MITLAPMSRDASTVCTRWLATVWSISGTPVMSMTTTLARCVRMPVSSCSVSCRARSLSSTPMIGVLDSERARQLTEQLLTGIRTHRAKVVVIDITGVPDVDETVANHLVQTVDASRLMGASVIITGLSPLIAQTLVTIGVDLSKMDTIGDLQGGLEEAERLLGYTVGRDTGLGSP